MRREMLEAIHYSHIGIAPYLRQAREVLFGLVCANIKDLFQNVLLVMNIRIGNVKNLC